MFRSRKFNKLRYKYYNDHAIDLDTASGDGIDVLVADKTGIRESTEK